MGDKTPKAVQNLNSPKQTKPIRILATALILLATLAATAADPAPASAKIGLWKDQAPLGDGTFTNANAFITVHRADKPNGASLVICPGGGYGGLVTGGEGHGIAQWLNQHDITGIVLEYRLPKGHAFVPLLDAQRAIRTARANAAAWNIDPGKIGIIGFSAGGHLASTAETHFDAGDAKSDDPVARMSCRPDFAILIYPVISMGPKGHGGSRINLMGKEPKEGYVDLFSNEKQITDQTPPTFLAHAQDDRVVDPQNSQMFYDALLAHKVPAQYLKLPSGGHGLNGYRGPMWDAWQTQSLQWLAQQNLIPQADAPAARASGPEASRTDK